MRDALLEAGRASLVVVTFWSAPRDRLLCREPGRIGQSELPHRRHARHRCDISGRGTADKIGDQSSPAEGRPA
jgi:hypothetical protein